MIRYILISLSHYSLFCIRSAFMLAWCAPFFCLRWVLAKYLSGLVDEQDCIDNGFVIQLECEISRCLLECACRKRKKCNSDNYYYRPTYSNKKKCYNQQTPNLVLCTFYVAFLYRAKSSKAGLHRRMHSAILYLSIQSESSISGYRLS